MKSVSTSHREINLENLSDRLRDAWADLLCRVEWDQFITLTVDPKRKRNQRMGVEAWERAWRWLLFAWLAECAVLAGQARRDADRPGLLRGTWVNAWRKGRGVPMWVLALEPHRDDRLHAHVLLKLTRDSPWLDYGVGHQVWNRERGLAWFEKPRDQDHVTRYVSEYVVKHEGGPGALCLSPNLDCARLTVCRPDQFAVERSSGVS